MRHKQESLSLAEGAKVAVWDYDAQHNQMPRSNASADMVLPASVTGNYVTSVNIAGGKITIIYGNQANTALNNTTLYLSGSASGDTLQWNCTTAPGGVQDANGVPRHTCPPPAPEPGPTERPAARGPRHRRADAAGEYLACTAHHSLIVPTPRPSRAAEASDSTKGLSMPSQRTTGASDGSIMIANWNATMRR